MNTVCSAAAMAVGCGLLWLSLIAKVADREATAIMWPVTGRFRQLLGPGTVSAAEALVVAAVFAPLPVAWRLLLLGACFTCYAMAATVLRGRRCACFGSWLPTRFSRWHAVGCGAIAALSLAGAFGGGLTAPLATAVAVSSAGVASAVAAGLWWRLARQQPGPVLSIRRFVIFVTDSCPYCAALEAQRSRYEALTDKQVEFRRAATAEEAERAGKAFPAAVGYDADGVPVTEPVHGLSQIRDLLRRSTALPETLRSPR
ncbi:hypothetical protein [Streptomyces lavendofoliae]|uniref:hypothetical protein n=1 Tax=Streptomyces lavendofoliae TaxID=67314 RepID=UPI00300E8A69